MLYSMPCGASAKASTAAEVVAALPLPACFCHLGRAGHKRHGASMEVRALAGRVRGRGALRRADRRISARLMAAAVAPACPAREIQDAWRRRVEAVPSTSRLINGNSPCCPAECKRVAKLLDQAVLVAQAHRPCSSASAIQQRRVRPGVEARELARRFGNGPSARG